MDTSKFFIDLKSFYKIWRYNHVVVCVVYTTVVSVGTHSLTRMWSQKAALGSWSLSSTLYEAGSPLLSTDATVSRKLTGLCTSASCPVSAFHLKVGVPSLQMCAITWVPGGSKLRLSGLHGKPLCPQIHLLSCSYLKLYISSPWSLHCHQGKRRLVTCLDYFSIAMIKYHDQRSL